MTLPARVRRLVFGARDPKAGAVESVVRLLEPGLFNHDVEWVGGALEDECGAILTRFFEDGSQELYNVEADPAETRDLAARQPAKVRELELLLDGWLAATRAPVPTALNPDFDPSGRSQTPNEPSALRPAAG